MEYVACICPRKGCDVYWGTKHNIHPENREGCVGKGGIDKTFTLEQMVELAYKMEEKPNILTKAGINAKWYMKKIEPRDIESEIKIVTQRKSHPSPEQLSNYTMYIIEWK